MYDMFENLSSDRKKRILNAALEEFAYKGYDDASTNNIVKKAEISKGILFKYFGNKKNLYLYLYRYARNIIDSEINSQVNTKKGDLIKILKELGIKKLEVYRSHPHIAGFIAQTKREKSEFVHNDLKSIEKEHSSQIRENYLFNNIDMTIFKTEFQNENTIKIIRWALDGCIKELQEKYNVEDIKDPTIGGLLKDYDLYMDIIRQAFYVNGGDKNE